MFYSPATVHMQHSFCHGSRMEGKSDVQFVLCNQSPSIWDTSTYRRKVHVCTVPCMYFTLRMRTICSRREREREREILSPGPDNKTTGSDVKIERKKKTMLSNSLLRKLKTQR